MAVQAVEPTTYPLSAATAEVLRRPLFGHFIEGRAVPSADGATMPVIDPASGAQIAVAAAGSQADVDAAVRSARAAFDDGRWRLLPPLEKERRLRRLAALLAERGDLFGELDVLDAGLLRGYTTFVVDAAVSSIEYFAGWPSKVEGTIPAVPPEFAVYALREPLGVVGLITPWNGPTFTLGFVAGALAAGNSVVMKPAEQTPMAAVLMAELALEAGIPPGVFNVVQGLGEVVGAGVVAAAEVDAISFTGSVATGSAIQAAAAARVKPVSLELGGKSPFIVFADADLDEAAAAAAMGVWGASGQVCTAATRSWRTRTSVRTWWIASSRSRATCGSVPASTPRRRWGPSSPPTSSRGSSATSPSAATRAPSSSSAASATATSASSTSRRSSAACATTCASPARRSSGP